VEALYKDMLDAPHNSSARPTMKSPFNEKTIDTESVLSDRTLCASPEPLEPPPRVAHVCAAPTTTIRPRSSPAHAVRVKARVVAAIVFALWSINLSLSLVEYFRLLRTPVHPPLQLRILLVWAVCSGLLVLTAAAVFVSTLVRRPSVGFVGFLRGFAIFMSATSCIVGFAVMFPIIAECTGGADCTDKERTMRLFLCGVS